MDEVEAIRVRWEALRDLARRHGRGLLEVADLYDQGSQTLSVGSNLLRLSTGSAPGAQSPYAARAHEWVISQGPLVARAEQTLGGIARDVGTLRSYAIPSVVSGTTMVTNVATTMIALGCQPLPQPVPQFDRTARHQRIDARLRDLVGDDRLGQRRQGAWDAYRLGTREGRVQACHSMRDIVVHLLEVYASKDLVRRASWWRPPDPAQAPGRRDQWRYFILGPDEGPLEAERLAVVERQVAEAFDTYTKACQIAHDRYEIAEASLWDALTSLEDSIDLVFEEREGVAYLRALAR